MQVSQRARAASRRVWGVKLGAYLGYWGVAMGAEELAATVQEAEQLGYDSVWAAEAYGSDAASVLAFLAARTEQIKLGSAIPEYVAGFRALLEEGAARAGRSLDDVDIAPVVNAYVSDDVGTLLAAPMAFGFEERSAQLRAVAELAEV